MLLLPTGLKAKAAVTGQTEMITFKRFCLFESLVLVLWSTEPAFLLRVPLTTLLWTLSTHCLTWPPPNRSPSTAQSWPSDHPQGLGRAIRACVHWHILSGEGWEVWGVRWGGTLFSWTRKLWIMLALPGRAQREPGWANWTRAGGLSRSSASCWHQAGGEQFIPKASPLLSSPGWHAAGIFLYSEVFSALAADMPCTDNLSLWNFENKFIDWM